VALCQPRAVGEIRGGRAVGRRKSYHGEKEDGSHSPTIGDPLYIQ
jgi:hypothetical protein